MNQSRLQRRLQLLDNNIVLVGKLGNGSGLSDCSHVYLTFCSGAVTWGTGTLNGNLSNHKVNTKIHVWKLCAERIQWKFCAELVELYSSEQAG